jgi:thiol-disulfide isomerase/thioredoxin
MTKVDRKPHSASAKTALLTAFLAAGFFAPALPEGGRPPADKPQLKSIQFLPETVINNALTNVKVKIEFSDPDGDLKGGRLELSVKDANKKRYVVFVDLVSTKFARVSNTVTLKTRLVCSASPWLRVTARLHDAGGLTSNRKGVKLKSVPNPDRDPTYKIDWPLGTEQYTRAFDFTLYDQNGKKVSLYDYYGKIIFVEFGAMWCWPCAWMAEDVKRLHKKWKNNPNVVFISVFHDGYVHGVGATQDDCRKWAQETGLKTIILADPEQVAWKLYRNPDKPDSVPQYMFIDPWMLISFKGVGYGPNFFYDQINNSIKYYVNRWFSD